MSEAKANTFALVAERFLADRRRELQRATLVPKAWQCRPIENISRKDVIAFLDALKASDERHVARDGQGAMEPWRLHDLRRSLVTGMHEHGLADPHTIELIVNHVGGLRGGIAGVYDRSTRMDARRKALEAWAQLIVNPGEADNVVPLRRQG